jgi:nitrate reductase gamma subunit
MKTAFLFQIWPYIACILFVAGMSVRFAVFRKPPATSRLLVSEGRVRVLQFSLFVLLLGHLAALLFPRSILVWNSVPLRLYALEAFAFLFGICALLAWVLTIWKQLRQGGKSLGEQVADVIFSAMLFTALLSGSLIAILFRWGSSWGAFTLTPYVRSLLRGQPAVALASEMPFLVRLHVVSAFATLAVFPGTRFAGHVVVAINRSLAFAAIPIHGMVDRARKRAEAAWQRINPAVWIWPEED